MLSTPRWSSRIARRRWRRGTDPTRLMAFHVDGENGGGCAIRRVRARDARPVVRALYTASVWGGIIMLPILLYCHSFNIHDSVLFLCWSCVAPARPPVLFFLITIQSRLKSLLRVLYTICDTTTHRRLAAYDVLCMCAAVRTLHSRRVVPCMRSMRCNMHDSTRPLVFR